jgi:hypothetical protein
VHFASDPARANLRVSGFLQAARALLFLAAGATPERSCFFFKGASTSSTATAALALGAEKLDDLVDEEDAAAGEATAAAVRDGSVAGPEVQSDTNGIKISL